VFDAGELIIIERWATLYPSSSEGLLHDNGLWRFSPAEAMVFPDGLAKVIVPVHNVDQKMQNRPENSHSPCVWG
jgi:hypothetical protein